MALQEKHCHCLHLQQRNWGIEKLSHSNSRCMKELGAQAKPMVSASIWDHSAVISQVLIWGSSLPLVVTHSFKWESVSGPNLLSGQRGFQTLWWRQMESPWQNLWGFFLSVEVSFCQSPALWNQYWKNRGFEYGVLAQILAGLPGQLLLIPHDPAVMTSSLQQPSLTASGISDHPTLPVIHSSSKYILSIYYVPEHHKFSVSNCKFSISNCKFSKTGTGSAE